MKNTCNLLPLCVQDDSWNAALMTPETHTLQAGLSSCQVLHSNLSASEDQGDEMSRLNITQQGIHSNGILRWRRPKKEEHIATHRPRELWWTCWFLSCCDDFLISSLQKPEDIIKHQSVCAKFEGPGDAVCLHLIIIPCIPKPTVQQPKLPPASSFLFTSSSSPCWWAKSCHLFMVTAKLGTSTQTHPKLGWHGWFPAQNHQDQYLFQGLKIWTVVHTTSCGYKFAHELLRQGVHQGMLLTAWVYPNRLDGLLPECTAIIVALSSFYDWATDFLASDTQRVKFQDPNGPSHRVCCILPSKYVLHQGVEFSHPVCQSLHVDLALAGTRDDPSPNDGCQPSKWPKILSRFLSKEDVYGWRFTEQCLKYLKIP